MSRPRALYGVRGRFFVRKRVGGGKELACAAVRGKTLTLFPLVFLGFAL